MKETHSKFLNSLLVLGMLLSAFYEGSTAKQSIIKNDEENNNIVSTKFNANSDLLAFASDTKAANTYGIVYRVPAGTGYSPYIFAEGAPLLIVSENSETRIYVDKNCNGVVDSGEYYLLDPRDGTTSDFKKAIIILGVSSEDSVTSTFKTELNVNSISTDFANSGKEIYLTITGGEIGTLYACNYAPGDTTSTFTGDIKINIHGGSVYRILGAQFKTNIVGRLTMNIDNSVSDTSVGPIYPGTYTDPYTITAPSKGAEINVHGKVSLNQVFLESLDNQQLNIDDTLDSTSSITLVLTRKGNFNTELVKFSSGTPDLTPFIIKGLGTSFTKDYIEISNNLIVFKNRWSVPTTTFDPYTNTISGLDTDSSYNFLYSDGTNETISTGSSSTYTFAKSTTSSKVINEITKLQHKSLVYQKGGTSNTVTVEQFTPTGLLAGHYNVYSKISSLSDNYLYTYEYSNGALYYFCELDSTNHYFNTDTVPNVANTDFSTYDVIKVYYVDKGTSLPQKVSYSILPLWVTPTATFNSQNATLSALDANATYVISVKASDGTVKSIEITPTSTSYDLRNYTDSNITSLVGYSLVNIYKKNDISAATPTHINSDLETLSGTIYPKEETPSTTFDPLTANLKGLKGGEKYLITYTKSGVTSTSEITVPTAATSYDLSTVSALVGTSVSGITLEGDGTTSTNSDLEAVTYNVLNSETTPSGVKTFTSTTCKITGLTSGATYELKDSTGTIHTIVADGTGSIDGVVNNLLGLTISTITKKGDGTTLKNSSEQTLNLTFPTTLTTPSSTFSKETGIISNLNPNKEYVLSDGTNEYTVTSSSTGTINYDDLGTTKAITSISQNGSTTDNTLISDKQTVNYLPYTKESTDSLAYDQKTDIVSGLEVGKSYTVSFDNGNPITFKATSTSLNLLSYDNGSLVNKKLVSVIKNGVAGSSRNSDTLDLTSLDYKVLPKAVTPISTFDVESGVISGLDANKTYILKDSSGVSHEVTASSSGTISFDSTSEIKNLTITSIALKGDYTSNIDSDYQSNLNYKLLAKETTPSSVSYDESTDYLKNLTPNTSYVVTFTDGTNYTIKTSTNSIIDLGLEDNGSLIGKTLSSIFIKGDDVNKRNSDSVSLSGKVQTKDPTPNPSFDKSSGDISGLLANTAYTLKDSDGNEFSVTSDQDGKINFFDHSEFATHTITSIRTNGTSSTAASLPKTGLYYSIMIIESISNVSYLKDDASLNGLVSGGNYVLTFSDGSSIKINPSSSTFDLRSYDNESLIGKTLTGVQKTGSTYSYDSEVKSISDGEILAKKSIDLTKTPEIDTTGTKFTNLLPDTDYSLTTSTGEIIKVTSDPNGVIDLLIHDELVGKTISKIEVTGDGKSTSNSDNLLTKPLTTITGTDYVNKVKENAKAELEKKISEAKNSGVDESTLNELETIYTSKIDEINKSTDDIKTVKLNLSEISTEADKKIDFEIQKLLAIDELTKLKDESKNVDATKSIDENLTKLKSLTNETSSVEEVNKLTSETKKIVEFYKTKDQAIDDIKDMESGCSDPHLTKIINKALEELSTYNPNNHKEEDLINYVKEVKAEIVLESEKIRAENQISEFNSSEVSKGNNSDLAGGLSDIKNKYDNLIDNAKTNEEISSLVSKYKEEVLTYEANNPIEGRCIIHYFIFALIILYIGFMVIYDFILKHKDFDLIKVIVHCVYLVAIVLLTIFARCSICVYAYIIAYITLFIGLLYLFIYHLFVNKNEKNKQSN